MESRHYVIQNKLTKKYKLGIKLFELNYMPQKTKRFLDTIKPYLRQLSEYTKETANCAILDGKEVLYIMKAESQEVLTINIKRGTRLPAHCTALGKALLAFLPDSDFQQLYGNGESIITLTSQSISLLDELKKELNKVKKQGYALDREEYKRGINCVGVPIFDGNGHAIAAISITAPSSRFTMDEMEKAKDKLITVAKTISAQL